MRSLALKLLCLLPTAYCQLSFSQTFTQTIRGRVIDADSKSPLLGANVILLNSDTFIGSATDIDGKYRLEKVPVGRKAIKATFLGYEEVVISNIIVTSGKEVVLQIEMHEKVVTGSTVEIVAERDKTKSNNDLVTNSARNFVSEETERYAGSRGDPSKMVTNFAGVATGNDARNDIIVRGNSPLGVLWRLEDVDIPNPNHFAIQGATGGSVSMLNNNLLGRCDFLTGAFPAEYGNKMAAVFDLKLRNGNNEKMEYTGQFGFNGIEAGIEGPLSKKNGSSFLVNYRYSTLEIFQALGISFGVSALPKYQDGAFKLNIPTQKKGVFTLWGIAGRSHIALLDSEKDSTDWAFTSKGEDLIFTSGMWASGISHQYFFNHNLSGKFSFAATQNLFEIIDDTLSANKTDKFRVYTNHSLDGNFITSYALTFKANAHHLIKSGIVYRHMYFDYNSSYFSREKQDYVQELDAAEKTGLLQGHAHWQYRVTDDFTINSGLFYQQFLLNGTQAIEPRLGLKWQFTKKQSLSLAGGFHSQMQPLFYYFFKSFNAYDSTYIATNRDLGLSRSRHAVAAYDFSFAPNFRLKLEGYYQDLYDIPVEMYPSSYSLINEGNGLEGIGYRDSLTNKGTGKNFGGEITIEKFFSKRYYFLSTLSVYDSKYVGSDNKERHSAFSGGYVFNVLGGIEFPMGKNKNKVLAFDLKSTVAGGNRYTPVDIDASFIEKNAVYLEDQAFSKRFRDYSKIDLKVSFRINSKKSTQMIFVHVENAFNHKNVLREVYDPDKQVLREEYQLGLFPYGGYRIEF